MLGAASQLQAPDHKRNLHVSVPAVPYKDLKQERSDISSFDMRQRIAQARNIQLKRYQDLPFSTNASLSGQWLQKFCRLHQKEHAFLEKAVSSLGLSARAFTRVLRIARTIADLNGSEQITAPHLAESINYRFLDRDEIM